MPYEGIPKVFGMREGGTPKIFGGRKGRCRAEKWSGFY